MTSTPSDFFPSHCAANEGGGPVFKVGFENDSEQWTEVFDLSALLRQALTARGFEPVRERDGWLLLPDEGLWLWPQIASYQPTDDGSVRTSTTIEVAHASLLPAGTFEYQHSYGDDIAASLTRGFDLWAQVDLVVFKDALSTELAHCTSLQMQWEPQQGEDRSRQRRVLFGPVAHQAAQEAAEEEEHPFCPCCLFTNTWDAYKPQIESDGVYGLRLYAARDSEGQVQADCRVNGEDWPAGAQALRAYVAQWPDRGFEFRKQYVVIQSPPET
ncbi:DUF6348 family protein [Variovorax sp. 770b2]|uniref:DUF6348 family protein n=1 Tax=Variovorax sp. 770b2 TaxID=1566271 RepID=UPI0008EA24F9|nr:DUF6348 family protein [Variovorax sp. 770b2]SFP14971.1 hypothetical protein SAMN03159339_0578 [Variovorax sp. 770b2]